MVADICSLPAACSALEAAACLEAVAVWARSGERIADAREVAMDGAQRFPDDPSVIHKAGVVMRMCGDHERAIGLFTHALDIIPTYHYSQVEIAHILADQGRKEEALSWYRRAIASAPGYPPAYVHAARLEKELGRQGDGERLLEQLRQRGDSSRQQKPAGPDDTLETRLAKGASTATSDDLSMRMTVDSLGSLIRPNFVNVKLFGAPSDYYVCALIVADPCCQHDLESYCIYSAVTGRRAGAFIDEKSPFWSSHSRTMPNGFRLLQAWLSELTPFTSDDDGILCIPDGLVLSVIDKNGVPLIPNAEFAWPSKRTLPLPSAENIVRIAGHVGNEGFLLGGATWFHRLAALTRTYLGRELLSLSAVLDWGVGCARIARHFLESGATNIYGADIDQVNIEWCQTHLGFHRAVQVDFDPPMPWPDKFFDLVYGHSVFTHLSFHDQFRWLAELRRVLKPGGFAFVTICSEAGVYITRWKSATADSNFTNRFLADGFYDFEAQPVGVDAGREGYYRLVAHTRAFVSTHWSTYFRVCRILPCYFDHQDLVILQRIDSN